MVIRLYLMPAWGLNSKVVTTGPGSIGDLPVDIKLGVLSSEHLASNFNSSASMVCCLSADEPGTGRELKSPVIRGRVVLGFCALSGRSVTLGETVCDSGRDSAADGGSSMLSSANVRSMPVPAVS